MAGKNEIVSELQTISSVLLSNSTMYHIPEFQRDFVWGQDEVIQLLNDFCEDTKDFTVNTTELEGYLLGNIVLIEDSIDSRKKIVVDGQQRLTTLSLIAKALKTIVDRKMAENPSQISQWSQRVGDISKGYYILDDMDEPQGLKITHDSGLGFGSYYNKLIQDTVVDTDNIEGAEENIYKVYNAVFEFLDNLDDDTKLIKFIAYFKNNIKLIVTVAPTEDRAFQLFEILNARGCTLEPMDLVKNLFLKTLSSEGKLQSQIANFSEDWKLVLTNLQIDSKRKIPSSVFLKQFILSFYGDNVRAEALFKYLKKKSINGNEILKFVTHMSKVSKEYKEIEKGIYTSFNDDQNMYIIFKILGIKQFHPVLMIFYEADNEQKREILDVLTRWGAAILFSYTQTNYIEKKLPSFITTYRNGVKKDANIAYKGFLNSIESEIKLKADEIKTSLAFKKFVGSNGQLHSKAMMILKFIELYFNQNTKIMSPPPKRKITVEHIMAQNIDMTGLTYSDFGYISAQEQQDYLHRLGNLTLLYNLENSSIGNQLYKDKLPTYKVSDFVMTRNLVEPAVTEVKSGIQADTVKNINKYEKQYSSSNGHWTKGNIEQRSTDLADLIYRLLTKTI